MDTPKLTAKTVRFFVFTLGTCQNGELGFDTASKLEYCDAGTWTASGTNLLALNNTWTGLNTFSGGTILQVATANPSTTSGRLYINSSDLLIHYADATLTWQKVPTLDVGSTWSGANTYNALQTFAGGINVSSGGIRIAGGTATTSGLLDSQLGYKKFTAGTSSMSSGKVDVATGLPTVDFVVVTLIVNSTPGEYLEHDSPNTNCAGAATAGTVCVRSSLTTSTSFFDWFAVGH